METKYKLFKLLEENQYLLFYNRCSCLFDFDIMEYICFKYSSYEEALKTHRNWKKILIHDEPLIAKILLLISGKTEERIIYSV